MKFIYTHFSKDKTQVHVNTGTSKASLAEYCTPAEYYSVVQPVQLSRVTTCSQRQRMVPVSDMHVCLHVWHKLTPLPQLLVQLHKVVWPLRIKLQALPSSRVHKP